VAQAFLRRGSRQVLATTERVEDALSERIVTTMYRAEPPVPGVPWDLASALRSAVRRLRAESGGAGSYWLFRVLAR
jgi:CHAT domain-containing protein